MGIAYMKRFPNRLERKSSGWKEINGWKKRKAVSEAGQRAVRARVHPESGPRRGECPWSGKLAPQKSSFSTGFIRVFDMAKCHVCFIYKPTAFYHFRCHFAILTQKVSKFHRFYKVF